MVFCLERIVHYTEYKTVHVNMHVLVHEGVKQDVGTSPNEEDRILSRCRRLEERGSRGSTCVRNRKREGENPILVAHHLHADCILYHYMEGRCSY